MVPNEERRKHPRPKRKVGEVSHQAQQRVRERVKEIMSRRDDAERRKSRSDQAFPRRRKGGS
jgi:hypothetical protein